MNIFKQILDYNFSDTEVMVLFFYNFFLGYALYTYWKYFHKKPTIKAAQ